MLSNINYTVNVNGENKLTGKSKDGVFFKQVQRSKHLFRKASAWGIDYSTFLKAEQDLCTRVVIYDTENKMYYTTTFYKYKEFGFRRTFGAYGEQIFLAETYFDVKDERQEEFNLGE